MSPVELQNLAQYLKTIYKVSEKNDLDTKLIRIQMNIFQYVKEIEKTIYKIWQITFQRTNQYYRLNQWNQQEN